MSRKQKILVLEDEAIVALDIEETLDVLGHEVIGPFSRGDDVLAACNQRRPDIALLDVSVAGSIDGIEVAKVLRSKHQIPVIFLTAHADEATLARAKVVQPRGYILKPFTEDELRAAIELASSMDPEPNELAVPLNSGSEPAPAVGESSSSMLAFLESIPEFSRFPHSELHALAATARFAQFDEGDAVFAAVEQHVLPFIVTTGLVGLRRASAEGKPLCVDIFGPNEFDSFAFFATQLSKNFQFVSLTPGVILMFGRAEVKAFLTRNEGFRQILESKVIDRLFTSYEKSFQVSQWGVRKRVKRLLRDLSRIPSLRLENGGSELPLTRAQVAEIIGATPETVIRVTKAFEREGQLDLSTPGKIVVLPAQ